MKALKNTNKIWIENSKKERYHIQLSLPISNNVYHIKISPSETVIEDSKSVSFEEMQVPDVFVEYLEEVMEEKEKIKDQLSQQEALIDGAVSKSELQILLALNQDVHYLEAALSSLDDISNFLVTTKNGLTEVDLLNLKISTNELTFELETIQAIINSLIDISDLIYSQKQNNYVKRLSILTILFSIPTFVTSFYGMNIALPFQSHPYLPIILIISCSVLIAITIILIRHLEKER